MRPAMSVALPAVNGTMTLIGCLAGQSCAGAATGSNTNSRANAPIGRRIILLPLERRLLNPIHEGSHDKLAATTAKIAAAPARATQERQDSETGTGGTQRCDNRDAGAARRTRSSAKRTARSWP